VSDNITLTGVVATIPRALTTQEGLAITSFRLASSQRRFDRAQEKWVDGDTNWYTITTFRQLAANAAVSVKKGERIVVTGRLRIRDWENGDRAGTNIEVDADALGHDLAWGTGAFSRNTVAASSEPHPDATQSGSPSPAEFPSEKQLAASDVESSEQTAAFAGAEVPTPF
jgi:single-strand DNA-binding protein